MTIKLFHLFIQTYGFLVSHVISVCILEAGTSGSPRLWGYRWNCHVQRRESIWEGARGKKSRWTVSQFPVTYWGSWCEQYGLFANGLQCTTNSFRPSWTWSPWGCNNHPFSAPAFKGSLPLEVIFCHFGIFLYDDGVMLKQLWCIGKLMQSSRAVRDCEMMEGILLVWGGCSSMATSPQSWQLLTWTQAFWIAMSMRVSVVERKSGMRFYNLRWHIFTCHVTCGSFLYRWKLERLVKLLVILDSAVLRFWLCRYIEKNRPKECNSQFWLLTDRLCMTGSGGRPGNTGWDWLRSGCGCTTRCSICSEWAEETRECPPHDYSLPAPLRLHQANICPHHGTHQAW